MKIEIVRENKHGKTLELTRPMRVGGKLFLEGFMNQASDESTFGCAVAGGIWSGLKYKGSLSRGLKSGALIELGMCTLNGVKNVLKNYRQACSDDDYARGTKRYFKIVDEEGDVR